jgi:hypothetical protein
MVNRQAEAVMGMTSVLHKPTARMAMAITRCPAGVRPAGVGQRSVAAAQPLRTVRRETVKRLRGWLITTLTPLDSGGFHPNNANDDGRHSQ